jgi:hypothetical protein
LTGSGGLARRHLAMAAIERTGAEQDARTFCGHGGVSGSRDVC